MKAAASEFYIYGYWHFSPAQSKKVLQNERTKKSNLVRMTSCYLILVIVMSSLMTIDAAPTQDSENEDDVDSQLQDEIASHFVQAAIDDRDEDEWVDEAIIEGPGLAGGDDISEDIDITENELDEALDAIFEQDPNINDEPLEEPWVNSEEDDNEEIRKPSYSCGPVTQFECARSGQCIAKSRVCNGYNDCGSEDKSDETDCLTKACHLVNNFRCQDTGKCIYPYAVCNGYNDCDDGSDETGCDSTRCANYQTKCKDGSCVDNWFLCDGYNNCGWNDTTDEENCLDHVCNENRQYRCPDTGICIWKAYVCNGHNNCNNGEDEQNCETHQCLSEYQYRCKESHKCVLLSKLCDGIDDCGNNENKESCDSLCRETNGYKCTSSNNCITRDWVCDGDRDCRDGEDEEDCLDHVCDPVTQYKCSNNGLCLRIGRLCNGENDCGNNEDELNCPSSFCATGIHYNCTNTARCIPGAWICDGYDDCGDNGDEQNCPSSAKSNKRVVKEFYQKESLMSDEKEFYPRHLKDSVHLRNLERTARRFRGFF